MKEIPAEEGQEVLVILGIKLEASTKETTAEKGQEEPVE